MSTRDNSEQEHATHRAKTNETGRDAANQPASFSREPADYRPTDHFFTRFDPEIGRRADTRCAPMITGDVIETCIREGDLRRGRGPRWVLVADVDGTEWWLVVGIHDDRSNDVLTAYAPAYHDVDAVHTGGGPA